METKIENCNASSYSEGKEIISRYNDLLNILVSSVLPEQKLGFDQHFEESWFKDHVLKSQTSLSSAISLITDCDISLSLPKTVVVYAVLFIGEHSKSEVWTSSQNQFYAEQLLKEILIRCSCSSLLQLLLSYKVDSFFYELRPKLLKDSWKNHPAAISCFMWILSHLECPHLGDNLNLILPTCLLLVDDHLYSNKVIGLQCLQHVANNVSRAELNQYGRGMVIYNAVEHMIYLREPEIIHPLASCLVALLSKTEHKSITNSLSWSHFDDVLNIWLPSMEMEQKLMLREAYIDSLNGLLQAMGLGSVRWSRKLLSIFSEYCEQDNTCNRSLMCLLSFMNATWPRISANFRSVVIILMKVTISIAKKESTSKISSGETLNLVKQCLASLEKLSYSAYEEFVNEIKDNTDLNYCCLLLTEKTRPVVKLN